VATSAERAVRIVAGTAVLLTLALAVTVSRLWLVATALIGVNLIQSALTGFCPAEAILRRMGFDGAQAEGIRDAGDRDRKGDRR